MRTMVNGRSTFFFYFNKKMHLTTYQVPNKRYTMVWYVRYVCVIQFISVPQTLITVSSNEKKFVIIIKFFSMTFHRFFFFRKPIRSSVNSYTRSTVLEFSYSPISIYFLCKNFYFLRYIRSVPLTIYTRLV